MVSCTFLGANTEHQASFGELDNKEPRRALAKSRTAALLPLSGCFASVVGPQTTCLDHVKRGTSMESLPPLREESPVYYCANALRFTVGHVASSSGTTSKSWLPRRLGRREAAGMVGHSCGFSWCLHLRSSLMMILCSGAGCPSHCDGAGASIFLCTHVLHGSTRLRIVDWQGILLIRRVPIETV